MRTCYVPKGWRSNPAINAEFMRLYPRIHRVIDAKARRIFGLVVIDVDDLKQEGFVAILVALDRFDPSKAHDGKRSDESLLRFGYKVVDDTYAMIIDSFLSQKRMPHVDEYEPAIEHGNVKVTRGGESMTVAVAPVPGRINRKPVRPYSMEYDSSADHSAFDRDPEDELLSNWSERYRREICRVIRQRTRAALRDLHEQAVIKFKESRRGIQIGKRSISPTVMARAVEANEILINPPSEFIDKFVSDPNSIKKSEVAKYMGLTSGQMDSVSYVLDVVSREVATEVVQFSGDFEFTES